MGCPKATATPHPALADVDDFLAWVEGQRARYEFAAGRLVMMAGGSEDHNDIQVTLLTALRGRPAIVTPAAGLQALPARRANGRARRAAGGLRC